MVRYDPNIIRTFAARLYRQAGSIIASYTILAGLLGGIGGYLFAAAIHWPPQWVTAGAAVLTGVVGPTWRRQDI